MLLNGNTGSAVMKQKGHIKSSYHEAHNRVPARPLTVITVAMINATDSVTPHIIPTPGPIIDVNGSLTGALLQDFANNLDIIRFHHGLNVKR